MEKEKLLSKLYHINLQLIDKLYNKLDNEWNNIENNVDEKYKNMIWLNSEIKSLLEYFNDNKKCEIEINYNWNKTIVELLPVIWFVYLYKFHS